MTDSVERSVLARREGRIGRITLNRPRALNALDLGMIREVAQALDAWRDRPDVHAVVIEGAGGRAFCAGGDIREIRRMAIARDYAGIETFFREEYALNLAIARYPKPFVALVDGICMGGGIGLSVHGGMRVATEAALFAMPETAIALFPDVGSTFVLPRLRGEWGMYMALTGARIGGAEAVWMGLATHFVSREDLAGLGDAIAREGVGVVAEMAVTPPGVARPDVRAFGGESVAAIVTALEATLETGADPWAAETLATLRQMSPSAVLWSFAMVRQGGGRTLEQCLQAELVMTRQVTRHPDFLEGVRAMVVDKDRTPRWSPGRIEEVDGAVIAAMFA